MCFVVPKIRDRPCGVAHERDARIERVLVQQAFHQVMLQTEIAQLCAIARNVAERPNALLAHLQRTVTYRDYKHTGKVYLLGRNSQQTDENRHRASFDNGTRLCARTYVKQQQKQKSNVILENSAQFVVPEA